MQLTRSAAIVPKAEPRNATYVPLNCNFVYQLMLNRTVVNKDICLEIALSHPVPSASATSVSIFEPFPDPFLDSQVFQANNPATCNLLAPTRRLHWRHGKPSVLFFLSSSPKHGSMDAMLDGENTCSICSSLPHDDMHDDSMHSEQIYDDFKKRKNSHDSQWIFSWKPHVIWWEGLSLAA